MRSPSVTSGRAAALRALRGQTLQLFDLATSAEVLTREPMPGFRPLLWHLAHIGVFQNYWILQRSAGQPSLNPLYDIHFDPIKTPREEATQLPSRAQVEAYLAETLQRVEGFLTDAELRPETGAPGNGTLRPAYAADLVLEHERQHQETVAFLFQGLPYEAKKSGPAPARGARRCAPAEVLIPGDSVRIGADAASFAYDNELPQHTVDVAAFLIDRDLTTNGEYAEFVEQGGYRERRFWSDAGRAWLAEAGITHPLYWSGPGWKERGFFAETDLRADAPVSGISWFEADAYARFRGKRLPSEFEWEAAAGWDAPTRRMRRFAWGDAPFTPERANAEHATWGTTPVGSHPAGDSPLGLHDLGGNVWEWTSSAFAGYRGFRAHPYPEYSQVWFDGDHRVSRGGSWFSAPDLLRTSFRNFYRRPFRAAFIGVRCARDAR
ncbi:MAG: SUMF1/EgtB/PvdO family nonheme iron enzyme [Candidatus Eremiobacteraeota bacterium]|nr:SUMF1/EgtB/PvdO family nonheme iron enzyme [Candidatus Eremiobacteraeota bacterium]